MTVADKRNRACAKLMADVHSISAKEGITPSTLHAMKLKLVALARKAELFPQADFEMPVAQGRNHPLLVEDNDSHVRSDDLCRARKPRRMITGSGASTPLSRAVSAINFFAARTTPRNPATRRLRRSGVYVTERSTTVKKRLLNCQRNGVRLEQASAKPMIKYVPTESEKNRQFGERAKSGPRTYPRRYRQSCSC